MSRIWRIGLGALLLLVAGVAPAGAQTDSITVSPADGLLDGQTVNITASTAPSTYGTLGLCPTASAPELGAPVTDLLSTRNSCVGLVCLHDGDTDASLLGLVSSECPLSVQPGPIGSVSASVELPRITNDGTDCAVADCVIVFNTWNSGSAQGAVSTPVSFDDTVPAPTTVPPEPSTTTTTTLDLSAPVATSTLPPSTSPPTTVPSTTSPAVPTQVLGAQETNDGELALTGIDVGLLAALGCALVVAGGGSVARSRRN